MRPRSALAMTVALAILAGCASSGGPQKDLLEGLASWYGHEYSGRRTANGEIFDPLAFTAAHRTLPFGTIVRVKNQRNGRTVEVRINDRGPFIESRIIDVSYAAAIEIDMVTAGVAPVTLTVLKTGAGDQEAPKPYVVTIPVTQEPIVADAPPPPVDFPLPDETEDDEIVIDGDDIEVEIITGDLDEPLRKTSSDDDRSVVYAPPPPASPARPAGTASQPAPRARFAVQLGAFSLEENANKLRSKVAGVASPVYVQLERGLYRVRVGPFPDQTSAIEAREKLDAEGFQTLLVTLE